MVRIGKKTRYAWEAICDSGAPVTVIPHFHWRHFARDIEWLTLARPDPSSWLENITGRTGGSSVCRAGRVEMAAFDLENPRGYLAPVPVIALFEQQPSPDNRILIGLHASILQGRWQTTDVDGQEAWLEDR